MSPVRTRSEIAEQLRRSAPSALRNREPIAQMLREWLPPAGLVLEVASGTGEHAVYLAKQFPALEWQPTDRTEDAVSSIRTWAEEAALPNLHDPLLLDAASPDWPIVQADALLCINMAHISPWAATLGLLDGAARILHEGGSAIFYGPWLADDVPTAPSNLAFDADLRERNAEWGIRHVNDLTGEATARGFSLAERRAMPANNFMLLLRLLPASR